MDFSWYVLGELRNLLRYGLLLVSGYLLGELRDLLGFGLLLVSGYIRT